MGVLLTLNMNFIGHPFVALLGRPMDAFGIASTKERIAELRNIAFPSSLAIWRDIVVELSTGGGGELRNTKVGDIAALSGRGGVRAKEAGPRSGHEAGSLGLEAGASRPPVVQKGTTLFCSTEAQRNRCSKVRRKRWNSSTN